MPNPIDPILTTFQIELLNELGKSSLNDSFFLTGGTALAACYLHHRLSEDLDFFTEEPDRVSQVLPVIENMIRQKGYKLRVARQFTHFLELFITSSGGETVKVDFAQDTPYRLRPIENSPWGVHVDNPLDISCNKLSALFERAAGKDFVDLFFITKDLYSFEELLTKAQEKHVGLDPYWLAMAFQHVEKVDQWPTMKRPCDFDELRNYFLSKARQLLKPIE